jgi:hypothetical protein
MEEVPRQERSPLVASTIDWQGLGVHPRWLGQESSDCAAALEPGYFHSSGANERDRFLAGARSRGETALVVCTIGDAQTERPRRVLATADTSLLLPSQHHTTVSGVRLPAGTALRLAEGLSRADRDLALRLKDRLSAAWSLTLSSPRGFLGGGEEYVTDGPDGRLEPILLDPLGDPVVAVWTRDGSDERWYIVPDGADWNALIDWLVRQALPAYVPDALRRVRAATFVDPDLLTSAEAQARSALDDLEERYAREKQAREQELSQAQEQARPVREGLLYETGQKVVDAVSRVLRDAGFAVTDLDQELGTKSADLLASVGPETRLIEVKSASGHPKEEFVGDLERHLTTWPALKPGLPVGGGALIVNHQNRLPPHERAAQVYTRPEFVATLRLPVLSSRQLFDWWRTGDWDAIRTTVLGSTTSSLNAPPSQPPSTPVVSPQPATIRKSRWPLGRIGP